MVKTQYLNTLWLALKFPDEAYCAVSSVGTPSMV